MGRGFARIAILGTVLLFVTGVPAGMDCCFGLEQGSMVSGSILEYGPPREVCKLKDSEINESSGLAASIRYPGAFWTHNDSGDASRIFLFNKNCETLATVRIKGATAIDWEDIASFKMGGDGYVVIADTGNNTSMRQLWTLYIVREPEISEDGDKGSSVIEVTPEWTIPFSYEDGPHDCEAVAVDATEGMIYLTSKDVSGGRIYSLAIPANTANQANIAKAIASLNLRYVTAMDISADGKHAIVLTYKDGYAFDRQKEESWAQAFARAAREIKMPARKQGESVCFGADGKTLYLTSENPFQPLWEVPVTGETK